MAKYQIEWPEWREIVNETFVPLIENRDRYLILYGGRGSGKSDFVAKKLVFRCLSEKYFRYVLIRHTYASIKDSAYATLKEAIIDLGLEQLFEFRLAPLEIECKINGNLFIARGLDDPSKLRSIKDVTGAWYEEDFPETEGDFVTVTTSIRTKKADYLQEIFTVNPVVQGKFDEHWFWRKFFGLDRAELSYSDTTSVETETGSVELRFTVHHSTYKDNRWLPPEFSAYLLELKDKNPYYHAIYTLGRWANAEIGGNFYKKFNAGKNVGPVEYDPLLPLWTSFDFNVAPGVTCLIAQSKDQRIKIIDEIQLPSPYNSTRDVCQELIRRYGAHHAGLFITGDPAGMHEDTRTEKGYNDFVIIQQALAQFRPSLRVARQAPPVVMRGQFINQLFDGGYEGSDLVIGEGCKKLIQDLLYGLEAADGTKLKQKVKDPQTGASYERYHHHSDCLDYLVCSLFPTEFYKYQRGGKGLVLSFGKNLKSKWTY